MTEVIWVSECFVFPPMHELCVRVQLRPQETLKTGTELRDCSFSTQTEEELR